MLVTAYTKSPEIIEKLHILEELRRDLHVIPISRKSLYSMVWDTSLCRIEASLLNQGTVINRKEIYEILTNQKPQNEKTLKILNYKNALDYIRNDWHITSEAISPHSLGILDALAYGNKKSTLSSRVPVKTLYEIKQLLSYVQTADEHPVIQAGIAYVESTRKKISPENSHNLATLIAYMFLYKYGWDFRELLVLEKAFVKANSDYQYALKATEEYNNATTWLDYFVSTLIKQTEDVLGGLQLSNIRTKDLTSVYNLKPRHMKILAQLDDPRSRITNKDAQEIFKISQITASRDLAKLAQMGLLLSHGKGRSTYYTRA